MWVPTQNPVKLQHYRSVFQLFKNELRRKQSTVRPYKGSLENKPECQTRSKALDISNANTKDSP